MHIKPEVHTTAVNADNSGLGPLFAGPCIVGYVEEINGKGAVEIPEFVATKAELLVLVKYWEKVLLDREYFFFATGSTGSTEMRLSAFAKRRGDRIISLLGDDAANAAEEVWDEFGKRVGTRHYNQFRKSLGLEPVRPVRAKRKTRRQPDETDLPPL